jgi:hypothetical protein
MHCTVYGTRYLYNVTTKVKIMATILYVLYVYGTHPSRPAFKQVSVRLAEAFNLSLESRDNLSIACIGLRFLQFASDELISRKPLFGSV